MRASVVNSHWSLLLAAFSRCGHMKQKFSPVVYTPSPLRLFARRKRLFTHSAYIIKKYFGWLLLLNRAWTTWPGFVEFFLQLVPTEFNKTPNNYPDER